MTLRSLSLGRGARSCLLGLSTPRALCCPAILGAAAARRCSPARPSRQPPPRHTLYFHDESSPFVSGGPPVTKYLSCLSFRQPRAPSTWSWPSRGGLGPSACRRGPGPGVREREPGPWLSTAGRWRGAESVPWLGGKSECEHQTQTPQVWASDPRSCPPFRTRLPGRGRPCPGRREAGKHLLSDLNDKPRSSSGT